MYVCKDRPRINQRYVVETITMTTVTERRLIQNSTDSEIAPPSSVANNNNDAGLVQPTPTVNPNDFRVMQQKQIAAQLQQQMQLKQQQQQIQQQQQQQMVSQPPPQIMIITTTTSALSSLTTATASTDSQNAINNNTATLTTQMSTTMITSPYEMGKNKSLSTAQAISGILKGGKLWKHEHQSQVKF